MPTTRKPVKRKSQPKKTSPTAKRAGKPGAARRAGARKKTAAAAKRAKK